jgi:hypothetical protein
MRSTEANRYTHSHGESTPDVRRRVPLRELGLDGDHLVRPCPELRDAASDWPTIDRPLVPLLNEFWRLGLATDQSCAGHPGERVLPYVSLTSATARALAALRIVASHLPKTRLEILIDFRSSPTATCVLRWATNTFVFTPRAIARLDRRARAAAQALAGATELPPVGKPSWEGRFGETVARLRDLSLADLPTGSAARPLRASDAEKFRSYFTLEFVVDADLVGICVAAGYFGREPSRWRRPSPLWSWSVVRKCLGCVTEEVSEILLQRGWKAFELAPHIEGCAKARHARGAR